MHVRKSNAATEKLEAEAGRLVDTYADMIRRICYSYVHSVADSEDIAQDVLYKTLTSNVAFHSPEHEKAWIIRVAINACKDVVRKKAQARIVPLDTALAVADEHDEIAGDASDVLGAVEALPDLYRTSIYLRYYEGYASKEIAEMTGQSVAAVDQQLSRGRKLLKSQLEGEYA